MLKLYNTLTRKLEEFKPINQDETSLYTCGPTVYDYMHIGNLRKFIFDDTLRRTLEISGFKVKHAMNITDVGHLVSDADEGEDKLEKGAEREGKSVWDVAQRYIDAFKKDVGKLNILKPNVHPADDTYARATSFVPQQINMIEILLKNDFAYQTESAIYFDVSKLKSYGELTGQKISDKEIAVRTEIVKDNNKLHPQDFAIWFFTVGHFADHDMHWPSPWGQGFPGWHIECSAIIHELLGDPIDIHTGGVDNIGTHHVNEMAQTEAAFGHKLANYWVHNEHLLVDGKKMSKSSGNFYTLDNIVKKGFDPLAFRLLVLQAHYRSQLNFTWDSLEAAQQNLNSLRTWADLRWQAPEVKSVQHKLVGIEENLFNDLNTAGAIASINLSLGHKPSLNYLKRIDDLLGLDLSARPDITDSQKKLIEDRQVAREAKDFEKSDSIRENLEKQGVGLDDGPDFTAWYRLGNTS